MKVLSIEAWHHQRESAVAERSRAKRYYIVQLLVDCPGVSEDTLDNITRLLENAPKDDQPKAPAHQHRRSTRRETV